ncbi:MAG TPA: FAD-binding oxidoreductase [Candidatus Aquilonibacter sp.]|nr:FAD-binding oxidoreductase [Candidatus Aquilonibacter sp.]
MNDDLLTALCDICGDAAVLRDPQQIEPYVTDWRGRYVGKALAVARPSSADQVSEIVRACRAARAVVIPQGGNTGLATGATPLGCERAVVVNLSRMRRILDVDPDGYTMAVEAGVVLSDVHDAAARVGRLFPLSLAAQGTAQIGGLISTNAGGTAVLRYGSMRSLVLGLEVVLSDGRIADGMRALYKDNAGYDWKQLFIGAEGTLGIVTRAILRLFPTPRSRVLALAGVDSCHRALALFSALRASLGETLTACELFPDRALALRLSHEPALRRPMPAHPWYVLVEATSALASMREEAQEVLLSLSEAGLTGSIVVAQSAADERALWEWRETISETEKRSGPSLKHDVSVPLSSVPAFIERATAAIERNFPGTAVLAFGHMGDGNIHFNVLLPPGEIDRDAVSAAVYTIIADFRGSITAEHGIGRYRRQELAAHRSASEMYLLHAIKDALDPADVMNPGAVLDEFKPAE